MVHECSMARHWGGECASEKKEGVNTQYLLVKHW